MVSIIPIMKHIGMEYWLHISTEATGVSVVLHINRHCVAFVYLPFLNEDLKSFVDRWNDHRIRPSKTSGCPSGIPNDIYHLPEINGIKI